MKGAFRNFVHLIRRFKISSILNVLGLSVAFAVFAVIMIQVYYDFSFDRNFDKSDNIYMISRYFPLEDKHNPYISIPLIKAIGEKIPEIKNFCGVSSQNEGLFYSRDQFENNIKYKINFLGVTKSFAEVFSPEIISGNYEELFLTPGSIMLSESVSRRLFGRNNAIGESVYQEDSDNVLKVVSVCRDFPDNSSIASGMYYSINDFDLQSEYSFSGYFEIMPEDIENVRKKLLEEELYDEPEYSLIQEKEWEIIPLKKIHLQFPEKGKGNLSLTLSLLAIGIVILIIAYINFINFSISMAPSRVRSINIQKILGAKLISLKFSIVVESILFTFISFLLSIIWISLIDKSFINEFFVADISINNNLLFLGILLFFSLFISVLIGLYPANYIVSFTPAIALGGSFSFSGKSVFLRKILVSFQFISAIVLIILSVFIKMQHDYMQKHYWGIQKENIVFVSSRSLGKENENAFKEDLKKYSKIIDYTSSQFAPGYVNMGWGRDFETKYVEIASWSVAPNFLDFFGVKIKEGHNFDINAGEDNQQVIFNEEFLKHYELKDILGKEFETFEDKATIVGIAEDINFESLRAAIRPMAFVTLGDNFNNLIFIKMSGENIPETVEYIKKTWEKFSNEPFDIKFLDNVTDNIYKQEKSLAKLITIFSIIAILISVMGVYGLILFNTKYKEKEIAIRKVNGASVKEIIFLINKGIINQLILSFIISVPIAYLIVKYWLSNFAYRTSIYWWVFLLGGIIVFIVTLLTVSSQSYNAASQNPTNVLNKE